MVGKNRRDFMKATGAAAAGALGGLSGYADGDFEDQSESADATDSTDGAADGASPRQETVTISFWSGLAAENKALTDHFRSSMQNYQQMNDGNVQVDLTPVSYGDMKSKLVSAVNAGNAPHIAASGTAGIDFFLDGVAADHGPWVQETGIAEDWAEWNKQAANFRGDWWAGGTVGANGTMLTVRPKFFKQAGVNDPSQLETWTGFTRALQQIDEQFPGVYAYEESGVWNDLESYWGQAQTAYSGGTDPWFQDRAWENTSNKVKVGNTPKTDGMMKACVDRARTYSSPASSTRTDEQMPALMLGDRAASNTTGFGNPQRWRAQNPDVTFGWDGDVWQGPIPRLDPNYGEEFGYSELAGKSGQHGGAASGLESQNQVFKSDRQDQAFDLNYYLMTNEDHVVPIIGELYGNVAGYLPINDAVQDQYDLVQIQTGMIDAMQQYTQQYRSTGAGWDIANTSGVRWDAMNRNISSAIAGQLNIDQLVPTVREKILAAIQGELTTTPGN